MKMKAGDIAKYSKFAEYVRYKVPQLVYDGPVVYNLRTNGHLTDSEILDALRWDHDPLIVITDLSSGQCRPGISAYGCFRPENPQQIEINEGTVKDFENSPNALSVGQNAKGKNVYIVGVTLLHELCHLGHFKHGKVEKKEAGFAFEDAAYGKSVP
jgi:hypothetical protein